MSKPKKQRPSPGSPPELLLGHVPKFWEREWQGMPEFVQRNMHPRRSVIVHFRSEEDVEKFAEMTGARIGPKTKFIWWPPAERIKSADMLYVERRKREQDRQ